MFEDFDDEYENNTYDLIVIDEFKGQRKLTWINKFVEGAPMSLRKKGSQYLKTDNPPVVILSNYNLEQCYSKVKDWRLEPFRARFDFIILEQTWIDGDAKPVFMEMNITPK